VADEELKAEVDRRVRTSEHEIKEEVDRLLQQRKEALEQLRGEVLADVKKVEEHSDEAQMSLLHKVRPPPAWELPGR
jgi:hypothetical protein